MQAAAEPWTLQAAFELSEGANDNVFLTPGGTTPTDLNGDTILDDPKERFDLITTLSGIFTLSRKHALGSFSASYQPGIDLYARYHDLNSPFHIGAVNFSTVGLGSGLLEQAKLELSDYAALTKQQKVFLQADLPVAGIDTGRSDAFRNSAAGILTVPFTDSFSAHIGYSHNLTFYEDSTLLDSVEHIVTLGGTDKLTERTSIDIVYSYHRFDFDGGIFEVNRSQPESHVLTAELASTITPTLDARVKGGASYRSDRNLTDFVGGVSLSKRFERTSVTARYARETVAYGGGFFSQPLAGQLFGIDIDHILGEHATARLVGEYRDLRANFSAQPGVTRSFSIEASAGYAMTRRMKIRAVYRHFAQRLFDNTPTTATNVPEFRNNTLVLTLTSTWGGPTL